MAEILQLKIYLEDIKPKIWRKFLVSDFLTFHRLHEIIQGVMGWENYHLYEFDVAGIKIGIKEDADYDIEDAKKIKLSGYLNKKCQKFNYTYDFGDSWEHKIILEKIMPDKTRDSKKYPCCIEGERACPPEDCGGVGGYERFLEILKTGKDPWGENVGTLKILT